MTKALVLYSGGLDSRLVLEILKEQKIDITALYFNLPFNCGCCNPSCNLKFTQLKNIKMIIIDLTKEPLLSEYLNIIKKPKHGRGKAYNPCKDCKIFMLKKAKEYAEKKGIEIIATGEVIGQRPMSQIKKAKNIIDKELGFEVLRPLSAKLLDKTTYEKEGLINREKLYKIEGRTRKKQIELAKKYKITYPSPSGGCILCEKAYKERFKTLLKKDLINQKTLPLSIIGKQFLIEKVWYIIGRNKEECEKINNHKNILIGKKGQPSVYYQNIEENLTKKNKKESKEKKEEIIKVAKELQTDFSKNSKNKQKYNKYKL
jgi:tRNA-uridine 2-sulfurtransferase